MTEKEKWNRILSFFQKEFGTEKEASIETMLFLIGVQELGSGPQNYSKDDKLNIIHIAVCRLLQPFGYYEFSHYDDDGFPHFLLVENMPELRPNEQSILMQKAIIQYFEDEGLIT